MRFGILMTAAVAALGISTAQAGTIHNAWEKYRANHALHHLSKDAQYGMSEILNARMALVQGDNDAAVPQLIKAQRRLRRAANDTGHFIAAEDQLNVSLSHPVARGHHPVKGTVQWVPVGGEFVVTETVTPERRAALRKTNNDIKTADEGQVNEDLDLVGDSADFIMAMAPVQQTLNNLSQAQVLAEGRHPRGAVKYIDRALDSVVYVDDDLASHNREMVDNSSSELQAPPASDNVQEESLPAQEPAIPGSRVTHHVGYHHHHHCPQAAAGATGAPGCCHHSQADSVDGVTSTPTITSVGEVDGD